MLLVTGVAAGTLGMLGAQTPPSLAVDLASPTSEDVLEGPTVLEATITLHGEIQILKVDFYVDGKRVGWADDPPYRYEWDAGNSLKGRQIRAVAYATDGQTYEAILRTKEIRIDYRERVSVVNVFATVRDFGGEYMANLEPEDFQLLEDDAPQKISHFAYENLPLSVVFVLDVSLTMQGERIITARDAAERFAKTLDFSRDRAAVVRFAGDPELAAGMTDDDSAVLGAIRSAEPQSGGTALYDGIMLAVETLRGVEGRKAAIILSDGRDESGDGFRPGSVYTFEEALEAAHQNDVILYTIGVGKDIAEQKDFFGVRTVGEILNRFAGDTGGRAYFANRVGKLRRAYENVATALRHQYSLGYSSSNTRQDGGWRKIRVVVDREGYEVDARKGYYAPG
jgi:Ca-activated chloride channel family protein